jgi:hypothetical protein
LIVIIDGYTRQIAIEFNYTAFLGEHSFRIIDMLFKYTKVFIIELELIALELEFFSKQLLALITTYIDSST